MLESFRALRGRSQGSARNPLSGPKGPGKLQRGPLSSEAEGPRRPRRRSPALTSPELEDARRPRDAPDPQRALRLSPDPPTRLQKEGHSLASTFLLSGGPDVSQPQVGEKD